MTDTLIDWTFRRPTGWLMIPSLDGLDDESWMAGLVGRYGLDTVSATRLRIDLTELLAQARAQARPLRRRWAFIPDLPSGVIEATMNVDMIAASGMSPADCLHGLQTAEDVPGVTTWERSFEEKRIANRPAVSGRELLVTRRDENDLINEHYVSVIFTPRLGVVLKATISTPNLALFADIVDYGDSMLEGISFDSATVAA